MANIAAKEELIFMKGITKEKIKFFLSPPHMSGKEKEYIDNAFISNFIAPVGENIELFEQSLKSFTGAGEVLTTNTGTAAIHLALIAAGVGNGDVVICQSFTFAASANPIRYQGAVPVFVDSEAETWNMDPEALESAILACMEGNLKSYSNLEEVINLPAQLPKAIIPVHLYGMPAKMQEINRIAKKYGIKVIEDSAEALGSTYKGISCGTLGDFGIFSFNGNKIITTSCGGALLSNDRNAIMLAKNLASQAKENFVHYEHNRIGYNYRLSNILAGIGIAQMEVIEERIIKRREIFSLYKNFLGENPSIRFLEETEDNYSNRWLTTILIDPSKNSGICKEKLRVHLCSLGIETRPLWKPMHLQPIYKDFPYFGNNLSNDLFEQGLCLPSGSAMKWDDIYHISEEINKITLGKRHLIS
jgi:dTDP-4-amino-4,6-dideoxygalactose transaminase